MIWPSMVKISIFNCTIKLFIKKLTANKYFYALVYFSEGNTVLKLKVCTVDIQSNVFYYILIYPTKILLL